MRTTFVAVAFSFDHECTNFVLVMLVKWWGFLLSKLFAA